MFNAIRYTKTLEAAGFSREQAEATIDVFLRFMEHNFSTKEDLQNFRNETQKEFQVVRSEFQAMRSETQQEFQAVRAEFRRDMQDLRNEVHEFRTEFRHALINLEHKMTIKLGLMQAASIGIFAALVKFL